MIYCAIEGHVDKNCHAVLTTLDAKKLLVSIYFKGSFVEPSAKKEVEGLRSKL